MKKRLVLVFLMMFCLVLCACADMADGSTSINTLESTVNTNEMNTGVSANTEDSFLDKIMSDTSKKPQLTKDEFLNIINSDGLMNIPYEKACFQTSGFNFTGYIVADNFLFTVFSHNFQDKDIEYELTYYKNGKPIAAINSIAEFRGFLDKYES